MAASVLNTNSFHISKKKKKKKTPENIESDQVMRVTPCIIEPSADKRCKFNIPSEQFNIRKFPELGLFRVACQVTLHDWNKYGNSE